MIIKVVIKCYKPYTDLIELAQSLDAALQQQGYVVYEIATRIVEEKNEDRNECEVKVNPSG